MRKLKIMTKKQKIVTSIVSLVVIGAIVIGTKFLLKENKPSIFLKQEVFVIEYGNRFTSKVESYITADKEVLEKTKISFDYFKGKAETGQQYLSVGTYDATAKYKNEKFRFTVEIKDTTPPEFKDFKDKIEVEHNYDPSKLASQFSYKDLSEVEVTVDSSNVDFSKAGEYLASVTLEDKYKNKTSREFTVVVVYKD